LSRLGISVQGGSGNLNPSSGRGTHGASWRMVVELGSQVSAQAIYPGGQSGNPVSDWYDDRIDKWQVGELDDVLFPEAAGRLGERMIGRVTLLAGGGR
jgi:penicillin amidase